MDIVAKKEFKLTSKWLLVMLLIYLFAGTVFAKPIKNQHAEAMVDTTLLNLSEQLLYNVKTEEPTSMLEKELATIEMERLINGLNNDDAIKTFWINMYNAWFQILAAREKKKRPEIFTSKLITIAGTTFSLDDIEHGILRRYRWKLSKGYLPKLLPGKLIKQLAVAAIDYRIHFALNCGAKSCPPIAFYNYDNINRQLDIAAKSYLHSETTFDDAKKQVTVSKIMSWFIADFGGKKGIKKIIKEKLQKDVDSYSIKFKPYDWAAELAKFEE
jgi:hypothetical protein